MPATFTSSPAAGLEKSELIDLLACASGGNTATMVAWVKPSESHTNVAYIVTETLDNADVSGQRFGFRIEGLNIVGEFDDGTTSHRTSGVTAVVNEWHLVILIRDGDTLRLWVLNAESALNASQERLWRNTGPNATQTGLGTIMFSSGLDTINIGRSPTRASSYSGSLIRFRGQVAFVAGFPGVLNRKDLPILFNNGVPSRLAYESLSIYPKYVEPLSSVSGSVYYESGLSANSNLPAFADNDSVWPLCGDPIRLDPEFLDDDAGVRAFWTFQEAPAAGSSAFVDRINDIELTYSTSPAGNGSSSNIIRVGDGLFGPHAILLPNVGLWVDPSETAWNSLLRFNGSGARVSVVAWLKVRGSFTPRSVADQVQMGLVAGVWDESDSQDNRQYALFHSLNDLNGFDTYMLPGTVNGHTSNTGGDSPGESANYEVSYSGLSLRYGQWQCMGMTWDGQYSRAYLNGRLIRSPRNPFDPGAEYGQDPYNLFASAAPFRVGGVDTTGGGGWGNFARAAYGGLAVFGRCLDEGEMLRVAGGVAP